jgi:hypothetical protein
LKQAKLAAQSRPPAQRLKRCGVADETIEGIDERVKPEPETVETEPSSDSDRAPATIISAKNSTNSTNTTPPRRVEFEAAVFPADSLIEDYAAYARQRLESADSYIIGSILPVFSACLARRVIFSGVMSEFTPTFIQCSPGMRVSANPAP